MKSIILPINPNYRLYENGVLLNIKRGKILKPFSHSKMKPDYFQYDIFNIESGKYEKIAKHRLKFFYFEKHNFKKISQLDRILIN